MGRFLLHFNLASLLPYRHWTPENYLVRHRWNNVMLSPWRQFFTVLEKRCRMLVGGYRVLLCFYLGVSRFENPWLSVCQRYRLNLYLYPFRRLRINRQILVLQSITLLNIFAFANKRRYHEGAFIWQAIISAWILHQFQAFSKHLCFYPYQLRHLILFILIHNRRWCVAQAGHF